MDNFSGRMGVTRDLALPTTSEHNMLLRFLNDQLTTQKKAMILWADVGRISETLWLKCS